MYTHHDNQQNILEVISEAQCVAAEQGKVSLQELGDEAQRLSQILPPKQTHKDTHASGQPCRRQVNCSWKHKPVRDYQYLT